MSYRRWTRKEENIGGGGGLPATEMETVRRQWTRDHALKGRGVGTVLAGRDDCWWLGHTGASGQWRMSAPGEACGEQ
jgi:hypothetical protein